MSNKLTKNYNATRRSQRKLTAQCSRLKRLTPLTLDATIEWGSLSTRAIETLWSTETAQTWYTHATYISY